ncbi:hypothetical protein C4577_07580 [Candidatus Parcubacteria bacterium]|nr:MAG: hypothetical protein C4577_07580 [Candidatus Parcubacteria bacterium]
MAKKRTSTADLLARRQQLQDLIKSSGGDGIFGGLTKAARQRQQQLQNDLANVENRINKRGGDAKLGMTMQDEQSRIAKNQSFWDATKSAGVAARGSTGPLSAGATTFSGVTNTAGEGIKAAGERVGGTPGEIMKITGAILQIAGKLDEWGKANLQGTYERFNNTSANMNWMAQNQSRRDAGLESHLANQLAPAQQELADSIYNRNVATQPYEEAWDKVKKKAAGIGQDFIGAGARYGSFIGNVFQTGSVTEGMDKTVKDEADRINKAANEESVDLVEWACDGNWISAYARPGDMRE